MMDTPALAAALANASIFRLMTASQRERIAARMVRRRYRAGSVIVRQGDTSISMYCILSGSVRVDHAAPGFPPEEVARLEAGEIFGAMGLIEDEPRSATIVAITDVECALLARWDLHNELRHDPEMALALIAVLSQRLRRMDAELAILRGSQRISAPA